MKTFLLMPVISLTLVAMTLTASASLHDIPLKDIEGKDTSLKAYEGKVVLIVNVASKCGFTPQYKSLEAIYQKYKDQGFVVLGFPCNDFGNQEPGSNEEIVAFCTGTYDVTFPMFDKLHVKPGANQHPLYASLTGESSPLPGDVKWNFGKFLVNKKGELIARFESKDAPDSEKVTAAIEKALKAD